MERLTLRGAGYATITEPGSVKEFDTYTCGHCGNVRPMRGSSAEATYDLGGHCRICDHHLCTPCLEVASIQGCIPFKKKLEEYEQRQRFLSAVEEG